MGSKRPVRGKNDFKTILPEAAREWDYEKNGDLRPEDIMAGSDRYVYFRCSRGHEWATKAYHRKEGHGCPYCTSTEGSISPGMNDIASMRPELMKEWDYEKNSYSPERLGVYSKVKAWWRCAEGHIWQAGVKNRAVRGQGCPYCLGKKLMPGFNDLETTMPELAAEWDDERNGDLRPSDVMAGTDRKVWWRCRLGHEWEAYIYSRKTGSGCPYCVGQKVLKGFNDLASVAPALAADWDDEKNGQMKPDEVTAGANRKVWWRCRYGHCWEATVASRYGNGRGCPYCAGHEVIKGKNDLASQAPDLISEWDFDKNDGVVPDSVAVRSRQKVWWLCALGHSYRSDIANRVTGTGCPYCAGRKVLPGFNDLETVSPELALEWNYGKNGSLTPSSVTGMSNRKVWWRCGLGHEWKAPVSDRHSGGCPYCANKRVLQGFNDLASVRPDVAAEWDSEKNGKIKPTDVIAGSHRKVWWRCRKGHKWSTSIESRCSGTGCPECARLIDRHTVNPGVNDLGTLSPWLLNEWDYERNGDLTPDKIREFSNRKAWWVCKNGHHWRAKVQSRQKGTGCPYCIGKYPVRSRLI